MIKFEILKKYITTIQTDNIGEWMTEQENDSIIEGPIQMSFVSYSEMVGNFINDVYTFEAQNKNMKLTRYDSILKDHGIDWDMDSMENVDVSHLNAQCVLALIMGAVRADRFCEGALFDFFKSGFMLKWLERLKNRVTIPR